MSSRTSAQWQAFVGPLYVPPSAPCSWDWSNESDLALAGQYATLTATLSAGSQGIAHTGLDLPGFGGVWIGPNGTGQAWEYCGYGSAYGANVLNLVREPIPPYEHNGIHSAGARVQLWAPLDTNDGRLHITEETNQALAAKTWTAELSGVKAPRAFLRRHHAIYVRERPGPEASWNHMLLGWIDEFQIDDDYKRHARWKIRVVSIAGMLEKIPSGPLRSGDLDIARYGKIVKEDVPLAAIYKEWNSGDYTSAAPIVTAKSAIDGDPNTAWIAERVVGWSQGYDASDELMHGEIFFAEANLGIPPGLGKGYRWVQLATIQNPIGDLVFCNKHGDVAYVDIGGHAGVDSRIFVVENLTLFTETNPLADPTRIKEMGSGFFDAWDIDNDHMAVWGGDYSGTNWRGKGLQWGPEGARAKRNNSSEPDAGPAFVMTGPRLTIPRDGRIIQFWKNPNGVYHTDFYRYTNCDSAGYEPGESKPDPFFLVQLPGMGFMLKTDLDTVQGGVIEVWDGKTTHTNGLPATGTLQIGSEQLNYEQKTKTTLTITGRGVNGTTPTTHDSNDPVYLVDNGQATDSMLIKQIRWTRPAGTLHPHHFKVWGSRMTSQPRHPIKDDEDPGYEYQNDYELLDSQEWYPNDTYTLTLSPAKRIGWLLFQVQTMNANQARVRINSFEAILDTSLMDSTAWLPEGTTLRDCFIRLLLNAGIPLAAMNIANPLSTSNPFKLATAPASAWAVLSDLADYSACYIDISLLSRITITNNTLWRVDMNQAPTGFWNRSNTAAVQILAERSGPVGQVQMKWMNPDGTEAGTLVYPDLLDDIGDLQILKDSLYPSAAAAEAAMQRRYLIVKYPYTVGIQAAVGDNATHPGVMQQVLWDFDDGTTNYIGYVRDVDTLIEKNTWKTIVRLILYREVY